jgi:hypothetical protein
MPPDLLDANEMTWAFVAVDLVGRAKKPQARELKPLAGIDR